VTVNKASGPERIFCDAVRKNGALCQLEAHPGAHVHVTYVNGWLEMWSRPFADDGQHGQLNTQDVLATAPESLKPKEGKP
jgi:hypothetical protein